MRDGGLFCSDTVIVFEPEVLFRWVWEETNSTFIAESEVGKGKYIPYRKSRLLR
jgi:hypothetical protein